MKDTNELKYVLYARKSSESDERQAMSIDGQLMEMKQKAKREKINIVETVTKSHSAKETGGRSGFNYFLPQFLLVISTCNTNANPTHII